MKDTDVTQLKTELAAANDALAKLETAREISNVDAFKAHKRAVQEARDQRDWLLECIADVEQAQTEAVRRQKRARFDALKTDLAKARPMLMPIAERMADAFASAMAAITGLDAAVAELQSKHMEAHVLALELGITDREVEQAHVERYQTLAHGLAFALQLLRCAAPASKAQMALDLHEWTRGPQLGIGAVLQILGASYVTLGGFSDSAQLKAALAGTHHQRMDEARRAHSARASA